MNDPIVLTVFISSMAAAPVILFFALRYVFRAKSAREAAASNLERDANGVMTVPVVATFTGLKGWPALLALASNSLNPVLVIRPGMIDYRVTGLRGVDFDQIESVRLLSAPGTVNLVFVFRTGPFTFSANVGTGSVAQTVLSSYPELAAKRVYAPPKQARIHRAPRRMFP